MGDGPTDINTPFLKDPFCLKHSVVDRAELTGQAVVKTHAPRRHGIPLCFFDQNEKLWLRPIEGLGGGSGEARVKMRGMETEEDYCPRL